MKKTSDQIYLGVDGGGTGCRVAISSLLKGTLAVAEGGRANATTDFDQTISNVAKAIDLASKKAGIGADALNAASAYFGLAGVQTEADANRIAAAFSFDTCTVTDDRPTTVSGALGGQDGFVISVGTGTIVARSITNQVRYVGGWGFYVADQASGAWLGRGALDRTLQSYDGVLPHSGITRSLMSQFGDDPNNIVAFSANANPGDYAKLAPEVISAGTLGDLNASTMLAEGTYYLERALATLGFKSGDALCLTGGVGGHYLAYLNKDITRNVVKSKGSALDGALQLAAGAAKFTNGGNAP